MLVRKAIYSQKLCVIGAFKSPELDISICQHKIEGRYSITMVLRCTDNLQIHSRHTKCSLADSFYCSIRYKNRKDSASDIQKLTPVPH